MRKLIVNEFLSLDGVLQAPGLPDEDREGGFEHGGWQIPYFDDLLGDFVMGGLEGNGGLVLGRKTYEIFAGYWPTAAEEEQVIAKHMNSLPKHVASRTLTEPLEWENSTLLGDDVVAAVRTLKKQPGKDLHVIGSSEFAQTLMENDLVDEYRLMIYPLVLGGGKKLFRDGNAMRKMTLADSKVSANGVLITTYRPAPE